MKSKQAFRFWMPDWMWRDAETCAEEQGTSLTEWCRGWLIGGASLGSVAMEAMQLSYRGDLGIASRISIHLTAEECEKLRLRSLRFSRNKLGIVYIGEDIARALVQQGIVDHWRTHCRRVYPRTNKRYPDR